MADKNGHEVMVCDYGSHWGLRLRRTEAGPLDLPLYHLLELEERETAVREAARVLKPLGIFVAGRYQSGCPKRLISQRKDELLGAQVNGDDEAGQNIAA